MSLKLTYSLLFSLGLLASGFSQTFTFNPNSGETGSAFGVTVTGSGGNFSASTTTVQVLASPSTINLTNINVTGSTTLTADINIPMATTPGTYNGRIQYGSFGETFNCTNCFTITTPPMVISNISPNNADLGETLFGVTFTGSNTNFNASTTCVEIIASPSTISLTNVNVNSTTELTADLTVPFSTQPGSYNARIYEGPGCSGASYTCTNCFTIKTPTITFNPNTGELGSTFGVTVTGTGTNFDASTTVVEILASPTTLSLTGITVTNSNSLNGTLNIPPGHTMGTYNARVFEGPNSGGTEYSCSNCFTITMQIPVELISFSGHLNEQRKVELNWSTASEISSDYFEVQRSVDGRNWVTLGEIKAAGFSSAQVDYHFKDKQPVVGHNYYRIRQLDYNGTETLSESIAVVLIAEDRNVQLTPNPTNGKMDILIYNTNASVVELTITDINGKVVQNLGQRNLDSGISTIPVDVRNLSPGIYFLISSENGQRQVTKFVKN